MAKTHSLLRPSFSTTWLRCSAAPSHCKDIPVQTNVFASEGTVAHRIREQCLRYGLDVQDFFGLEMSQDGSVFTIDETWENHLQPSVNRIRDLVEEYNGKLFLEHRVFLDPWVPKTFGTLDVGIVSRDLIVIDDLKFGEGVPVSAFKNDQLRLYALGFWNQIARKHTKAKDFLIYVDQPRAIGGGGEYRVTLDELLEFGEYVKRKAEATRSSKPKFNPGLTQCKWCPAALTNRCEAYTQFNLEMISAKFENLDEIIDEDKELALKPLNKMQLKTRSFIVKHESMIRKWLEVVHADTLADALAGRPTPDLKAVIGRKGARAWRNEKKVAKILERKLGEKAYKKSMLSPSQVEELIGKKKFEDFEDFWTQSEGKPILVPENDARKAVKPTVSKFVDLDGD